MAERRDPVVVPPRSAFVTGVGRGFSILYGIATMGLLVGMATLDSVPGVPHWRLLMSTALIVDTGTLIAAIGLLRQRPWARPTFIVALCASIVLGFAYGLATEAFAAVRWAWIAGLLGSALLYGWIIAKLCSAPIRAEFGMP
ncbi:MAG: hypothetical protein DMD45_11635 [Gemmatimonadetes bacterium]|nr:MAG: hypothetical protein DMD45_11635 [Gemmatimonadota bacterium]